MQTLTEIRALLEQFGLAPQKRLGQNFLFDQNLLIKIVELAELTGQETLLEVGPGTGSMTEELLAKAGRVVAVEIDKGMHRLLESRLGERPNFTLLHTDILAGKHEIEPAVLAALGQQAVMVANLPYNVATPLIAQCLVSSWRSLQPEGSPARQLPHCLFTRLIFLVQAEVADRFVAGPDSPLYGPVSVITSLLGQTRYGPLVPNTSFWPKPQVVSRIVRVDFDAERARQVLDIPALKALLSICFNQRRKQLSSVARRKNSAFDPDQLLAALDAAGIERTMRAEEVTPEQFLQAANQLAGKAKPLGGFDAAQLNAEEAEEDKKKDTDTDV